MALTLDQRAELDGVLAQLWPTYTEAPPLKREVFYQAVSALPPACVKAAAMELAASQERVWLPAPNNLAQAAAAIFRKKQIGDARFRQLSPLQQDLHILIEICASIDDAHGEAWRFIEGGLVNEKSHRCIAFASMSVQQITRAVGKARDKYGDPLPKPVFLTAEEGSAFVAQALELLRKAWKDDPAKRLVSAVRGDRPGADGRDSGSPVPVQTTGGVLASHVGTPAVACVVPLEWDKPVRTERIRRDPAVLDKSLQGCAPNRL